MNKQTHDPKEKIQGLQQLLISDKKKLAFLFGAGTSVAKKNEDSLNIPHVSALTAEIETELVKHNKFNKAINEIKEEIGKDKYNIETLLSKIEQKQQVIGKGTLNGLNTTDLKDFIKKIKTLIREKVSIHKAIIGNNQLENLVHVDFAEWIARADRKFPIEIFTTNYDYLFELGMEAKEVPYYDGFSGSYEPFFNSTSVENMCFLPQQTKFWKLHGSLGWHFDENKKRVIRLDSSELDILIYPSTLKYSDSKKQPYISLMDRLSNFLKQEDTLLITCGYSFGDEHINERLLTALNTNTSSHVIALCYGELSTSLVEMAKGTSKLSVYGQREAIIGCQFRKWKLEVKTDTPDINLYFDEDAPVIETEKKDEESWTGEGSLLLPDFSKFVVFLKSMIIERENLKVESK